MGALCRSTLLQGAMPIFGEVFIPTACCLLSPSCVSYKHPVLLLYMTAVHSKPKLRSTAKFHYRRSVRTVNETTTPPGRTPDISWP